MLGELSTTPFLELDGDEEAVPELNGTLHGGWCRNAARPLPSACAWDGMIDEKLCDKLLEDAQRLVDAGSRTFWIDANDEPQCALECLALQILNLHSNRAGLGAQIIGAEWWVQVRDLKSKDPSIGLHWDTDEELKSSTAEVRSAGCES